MQQLADAFFRAARDKDVTALDTLFTEDAVYVERNGETFMPGAFPTTAFPLSNSVTEK